MVHGGSRFTQSTLVTPDVEKDLGELSSLAPLHNPAVLEDLKRTKQLWPKVKQVLVFDTAFHQTIPWVNRLYPIPERFTQEGMVRYGFHGISFQCCTRRVHQIYPQLNENSKIVICHLGAGASLCAVRGYSSVDTTMGFTPLDGLMMSTRSGSVDPGILLLLQERFSAQELTNILYHESGLLGVSGISDDVRVLEDLSKKGEKRAQLALDLYVHRIQQCLGSMIASLGGLDALVFTGGVGENSAFIREKVCENFKFLGKIWVSVIKSEENFEIARECWRILGQ
jgi:acetate kinase